MAFSNSEMHVPFHPFLDGPLFSEGILPFIFSTRAGRSVTQKIRHYASNF